MKAGPITRWDYEVLDFAKDHIKYSDLWSDEFMPDGGVHIKPRPLDYRVDVIEINQLYSRIDEDELAGMINVNIFHTDVRRINSLTEYVELIMNDAYVEDFVFRMDFARLFRDGKYRWFNNIRYKYTMDIKDFNNRYEY